MKDWKKAIILSSVIFLGSVGCSKANQNREILTAIKGYLSDTCTVWQARSIADQITNQDLLYEAVLAFANSGNPSNAVSYAKRLTDMERQYKITEIVIKSGNPANGRRLLQTMPNEYKLKGIELLISTGNPRNAELLRNTLE